MYAGMPALRGAAHLLPLLCLAALTACSSWKGVADDTDWNGSPGADRARIVTVPADDDPRTAGGDAGAEDGAQTVEATGLGRTQDEATQSALRDAVAQVVGTLVRAEDRVENERLIDSKVLTFANGFVTRFEPMGEPRPDGSMIRVRVRAQVQRERLTRALNDQGVHTAPVDLRSMSAQARSLRTRQASGMAMLEELFRGFPGKTCQAGVVYQRLVESKGRNMLVEVGVRLQVNPDRWEDWCRDADRVLGPVSLNCGPIHWNVDTHHWSRNWEASVTPDTRSASQTEPFTNALMLGKDNRDGFRGRFVNLQPKGSLQPSTIVDWTNASRQERHLLAVCDAWKGGTRGYVLPPEAWDRVRTLADRVVALDVRLVDAQGRPLGRRVWDWEETREPQRLSESRTAVFDGGRVGRPEAFVTRHADDGFAAARVLYAPGRWYGGQVLVPGTTVLMGNRWITTQDRYVDIVQPALLPCRGSAPDCIRQSEQLMLLPCFAINGTLGQVATQQLVLPFRFEVEADRADMAQAVVLLTPPAPMPWEAVPSSAGGANRTPDRGDPAADARAFLKRWSYTVDTSGDLSDAPALEECLAGVDDRIAALGAQHADLARQLASLKERAQFRLNAVRWAASPAGKSSWGR